MADQPTDYTRAMMAAADAADSVADMPPVGTYAKAYADQIGAEVNDENVQAFLHGASVVNLLVQEAILRVSCKSEEDVAASDDDNYRYYARGAGDGVRALTTLVAPIIDDLLQGVIEGPVYDREFKGIVSQF